MTKFQWCMWGFWTGGIIVGSIGTLCHFSLWQSIPFGIIAGICLVLTDKIKESKKHGG